MLGSSIGKAAHASPQHGGPPAAYAAAAVAAAASTTPGGGEEELDDHSGSCPPPMYNPRTAWAGDARGLSSLQTSPPPAHTSPTGESMGPRTTQDLLDLEEENRVLRREVTRLQQLNEARRKQLGDMQSRIDGLEGAERAQSEMSRRERERERETRRSASPPAQRRGGGGGGGGAVTPPGSPRAQQQRLEAQVQRWKQKAFAQEERYSLLWNEVSRAGGDGGSAALTEALRTVASVGKTGLQEMADLEEAFDMVKGELRNTRAALAVERERGGGGGSSDGGDVAAVAYSAATSQTSPRDRRGRSGSPSGGGVCHQCAEHRFSIATLHDKLADVEADAAAKQRRLDEAVPSFPFLTALPGLESLEASLEMALHGRDAALNLAVATSDYLDNYLHCIHSAPLRLPALPPAPAPTPSETPHHQPQDFPSSSAGGATATGGVAVAAAASSSHHQHPVPHPSLAAAADPPTLASSQRSGGVGSALAPAAVPSAAASVAGAAHSVVASAGQYVSSSSLGGNGAALSASSSSGGAAGVGSVGGSPQQVSAYVSGGSSVAQAVSAGMPPQAPPSSMRALESDAALDAADDDDMEQYAP